MQRAWKSRAARFPNARMKTVAQLNRIAFGKGVSECGLSIWLPPCSLTESKMRASPPFHQYAPLSALQLSSEGHHFSVL